MEKDEILRSMHLRDMRPGEKCGSCGCVAWGGERWYDGRFGVCCAEEWDKAWNDSEHNTTTAVDTQRDSDAVCVDSDSRVYQRNDQSVGEVQPTSGQCVVD